MIWGCLFVEVFNFYALACVLFNCLDQQQPNIDGQGDITRMSENFETSVGRRSREEEHESRSGSDNMDGASGDDQDAADNPPRKKRYHRHTPQQIQELEAYDIYHKFALSTRFFE